MEECDILGGQIYSDPSYIFRGWGHQDPLMLPRSTFLNSQCVYDHPWVILYENICNIPKKLCTTFIVAMSGFCWLILTILSPLQSEMIKALQWN